jgi:signal peptidase I
VSKHLALRYAFFTLWFIAAPAAIALLALWLVVPSADVIAVGLPSRMRELVKDQPVPALIVLFTVFEMLLYAARYRLPLSQLCGFAGPAELPSNMRGDFEQAGRLLEDVRRLMVRNRRVVEREVPSSIREEIDRALDQLQVSMQTEPFVPDAFFEAHNHVNSLVTRHLERWQRSDFLEYVESIGVAIAVALLLRAFVVEAFKIPSGSMLPTLQLQDHIFVNKLAYGPVIPFTKTRLWNGLPPLRGDVMVFEYPDPEPNPRQDYIKRVIAIPGDTLVVDGGHPIINGWRVPSCLAGTYNFEEGEGFPRRGELYVEFMGDYSYLTIYEEGHAEIEQGPYHVAPGEVWVLGDNRNNSADSRAWNHNLGAGAPFENIKGRALFVWLSLGGNGWPTLDRMFTSVLGRPRLPKGAPGYLTVGIDKCLSQRPSVTLPPAGH